jgi:AcrR family transcriptional regulator
VIEQRIIEALATLINEGRPMEISMAAVARRAAVSEPTVYRHFPTKRDLFAALASGQFLSVAVLLLTSPMTWLYRKDYLGLDPAAAADTAGWAIKTLAGGQ